MTVVSADTTRLAIVAEATPGNLPANPAWMNMAITGESLNFEQQTSESGILDPSRGVRDQVNTGGRVNGDTNYEFFKADVFDAMLEAALANTWGIGHASLTPDDLIIGSELKTHTIERTFLLDAAPTYTYHRFRNCVVAGMSMNFQTGQPVAGTFSFSGSDVIIDAAEVAGATYIDPGVLPVFRPSEIITLDIGGFTGVACGQSLTLNLNGNVRPINCLGEVGAREQVLGRAQFTVEGAFYFSQQIDGLYQAFLDSAEIPATLKLEDTAAQVNAYTFAVERSKIASMTVNASGSNEDVVASINLTGLRPAGGHRSVVKITRETAP